MRCLLPSTSAAAQVLRRGYARSRSPARKSQAIDGDGCRWSTICLDCRSCDPLLLAENQLGGATRNHMRRSIRRPSNDARHDRRINDAQTGKAMHTELWVDDGEFIHAHFACANGMSEARRSKPGEFPDLLCGRLRAWNEFGLAHTVKGMLISEFTSGFDGAHDGRKIMIGAEIVAIDHGGVLKV